MADEGEPTTVKLLYDRDHVIEAVPSDTVASALLRAGHYACTRSPKYRRARGPYCLLGDCGSCQLRIDGQPNLRACTTPVCDGMEISSQNTWGPPGLDPTGLIDHVFSEGIDHHHMMVKPRVLNQVMQATARSLTGFGTLPDIGDPPTANHRAHRPDVLVVGAGLCGRMVANRLEAANIDVCTFDRRDKLALEVWDSAPLPQNLFVSTGVFAAYPGEGSDGRWAAASSPTEPTPQLHTIYPRHVVLAVGARDPMMLLARNDLPGVVSARGLVHMLDRTGIPLPGPVVVITRDHVRGRALCQQLHLHFGEQAVEMLDQGDVRELVGSERVTGVVTANRTIPCNLVALAPTPAPAHELAVMAGVDVAFNGHGYAPVADEHGRCQLVSPSPWHMWTCGDLRAPASADHHRGEAEKLADTIISTLRAQFPTGGPA